MGGSTSTVVVPPYLGADPAGSRSAENPEQALDVGDAAACEAGPTVAQRLVVRLP
jgi:hypothetical protein